MAAVLQPVARGTIVVVDASSKAIGAARHTGTGIGRNVNARLARRALRPACGGIAFAGLTGPNHGANAHIVSYKAMIDGLAEFSALAIINTVNI